MQKQRRNVSTYFVQGVWIEAAVDEFLHFVDVVFPCCFEPIFFRVVLRRSGNCSDGQHPNSTVFHLLEMPYRPPHIIQRN